MTARRGAAARPTASRTPRGAEPLAELQGNAQRAAKLLKAMSNPARLVVLCQLAYAERSVGELERAVGLSQSGISQHLAVLRREGVVSSRRVRQTVLYSLASREVVAVMSTLYSLFCSSDARLPAAVEAGAHPSMARPPGSGERINGAARLADADAA
ncbi:MAG: ArsR/SmtB family transcription factor [Rudaea sp.]